MNPISANVAGRKIRVEWADFPRPEESPGVIVTETTLMEVIGAIDEALEEEDTPAKNEFITVILSHLLRTGRIKFKGRLKNCQFEIV